MKNILFIRSTTGFSGAERYTLLLARGLRRKQKDARILTNYEPFAKAAKKEGIPCQSLFLPIKEAGTKREFLLLILWFIYLVPLYLWTIKRMEEGRRFDAIVLESMNEKLFLSPYLVLLGYKVFWIEHGPLFRTNRFGLIKWLYRRKTKWPRKIIAVSDDTKKDLIDGGLKKEKIERVYIGIDAESPVPLKLRRTKWVIGFVGSLTREKGFMEFGQTAFDLLGRRDNVSFVALGDGPLLSGARKRIQEVGLEKRFQCLGRVEDVNTYLKKIDILYLPTHHEEGISLALLEAMAQGVIIVTRDIGGNRELVVDRKTGFLFDTPKEGEEILEKLISGTMKEAIIRKQTIAHVRSQFSLEPQVSAFLRVFDG